MTTLKTARVRSRIYLALAMGAGVGCESAIRADDLPAGAQLGMPTYSGTGCPSGTASAALSPDGTALSVLFDRYQAQAGKQAGLALDRKSCDLAIPLHVPTGYTVSVLTIDYRGYNDLPAGGRSTFNAEYFFAGAHGPTFSRSFYGPVSSDFDFQTPVTATGNVWSPCGSDTNLRVNSALMVETNAAREQAMATVDSADVAASVVFALQWKSCHGGGPGPGPGPGPGDYQGNCTIDQDPRRPGVFLIRDQRQNLLGTLNGYPAAVAFAKQADASGRCLAGLNPHPIPTPTPPPTSASTCQVTAVGRVFTGTGASRDIALDLARRSCLLGINNARICNAAPLVCR